jgi:NAD(P)-dependent dehydrogenase (short-subunit alcohol dehydrogenase family)
MLMTMQIDIEDKVVVVTGAAQGIGRALALGLAAEGARVAVVARDQARAQAVVDALATPGLAIEADVTDEAAVQRAASEVEGVYGRLDALINNAGLMAGERVLDMELELLQRVLNANLVSAFLSTKHFAPLMIRGGGGRIVYLSSAASIQAGPGSAAYGGAKAAINILANIVHHELGDDGIRTTALAPGLTVTPGMRERASEEHIARTAARYPGGRVGQPEDLVGLVTFLCSEVADHISGSLIMVRPPVNR